jgi:hypothetical protein
MLRTKASSLFMALLCVCALAACASPVITVNDPELKAQALFAEYVIAEEAAVEVMRSTLVPDNIKAGIKHAHAQINPLIEAIHEQREVIAFLRINKPEDVAAAMLVLDQLVTKITPLVRDFKRSMNR